MDCSNLLATTGADGGWGGFALGAALVILVSGTVIVLRRARRGARARQAVGALAVLLAVFAGALTSSPAPAEARQADDSCSTVAPAGMPTPTASASATATPPPSATTTPTPTAAVEPGSVTGSVWFDDGSGLPGARLAANGARDADWSPAIGSAFHALEARLLDATGAVVAVTPIRDDGGYRFDGIAPGSYSVQFAAPGEASLTVRERTGLRTARFTPSDYDERIYAIHADGSTTLHPLRDLGFRWVDADGSTVARVSLDGALAGVELVAEPNGVPLTRIRDAVIAAGEGPGYETEIVVPRWDAARFAPVAAGSVDPSGIVILATGERVEMDCTAEASGRDGLGGRLEPYLQATPTFAPDRVAAGNPGMPAVAGRTADFVLVPGGLRDEVNLEIAFARNGYGMCS